MRWLLGFRVGLLLVVLNLLSINMMAQQERGTVNLTYWGVTLTLPTGWSAQRGDNALGVSADDGSGVILIIPHALKTLAEIKTNLEQGFKIGEDTDMQATEYATTISPTQAGAPLAGTFNGGDAMGYLLGITNAKGQGLTVFALTNPEFYDAIKFKNLAIGIGASLKFTTPAPPPNANYWKTKLGGCVLSAFESYNGGSSGGYSSEMRIDLCTNGNCRYFSQSSVSMYGGGLNGGSNDSNSGNGKWTLAADIEGHPMLNLHLTDGAEYAFLLGENGGKISLNSNACNRTTAADGGQWAPQCD